MQVNARRRNQRHGFESGAWSLKVRTDYNDLCWSCTDEGNSMTPEIEETRGGSTSKKEREVL